MKIKLDEKTITAIEGIIGRGNDAEVHRKKDQLVVLEVKKTIRSAPV